jgi:hypothetical protein
LDSKEEVQRWQVVQSMLGDIRERVDWGIDRTISIPGEGTCRWEFPLHNNVAAELCLTRIVQSG